MAARKSKPEKQWKQCQPPPLTSADWLDAILNEAQTGNFEDKPHKLFSQLSGALRARRNNAVAMNRMYYNIGPMLQIVGQLQDYWAATGHKSFPKRLEAPILALLKDLK